MKKTDNRRVRIRLKELAKARGLNLLQVSQASHIRYATIWAMSRDEVTLINLENFARLCRVLKCEPGELLILEQPSVIGRKKKAEYDKSKAKQKR